MNGLFVIALGIFTAVALTCQTEAFYQSHLLTACSFLLGVGIAMVGFIIKQIDETPSPPEITITEVQETANSVSS